MKIGLILCADLEKAQYLYKYIELLDSVKCCYDVIYWNRNLSNYKIQCDGCLIPFNEKIDSFKPLVFKVRQYLRFLSTELLKKILMINLLFLQHLLLLFY